MKQSGHVNPSEETGTGCPVTSKYGKTPPNKHGGMGRQQQQQLIEFVLSPFMLTFSMMRFLSLLWVGVDGDAWVTGVGLGVTNSGGT